MTEISEKRQKALERLYRNEYTNDYDGLEDKTNDWLLVEKSLDRLEELEGE